MGFVEREDLICGQLAQVIEGVVAGVEDGTVDIPS